MTKNELEQERKIVLIVPPLHGKALKWQLPFRGNKGSLRSPLLKKGGRASNSLLAELLINWMDAGHPLAQNERCLHMFLQEEATDRNYIPGKVCPKEPLSLLAL